MFLGSELKNVNGVLKFHFFFLNLSSKFPARVRVRMSKYPYVDVSEMLENVLKTTLSALECIPRGAEQGNSIYQDYKVNIL